MASGRAEMVTRLVSVVSCNQTSDCALHVFPACIPCIDRSLSIRIFVTDLSEIGGDATQTSETVPPILDSSDFRVCLVRESTIKRLTELLGRPLPLISVKLKFFLYTILPIFPLSRTLRLKLYIKANHCFPVGWIAEQITDPLLTPQKNQCFQPNILQRAIEIILAPFVALGALASQMQI